MVNSPAGADADGAGGGGETREINLLVAASKSSQWHCDSHSSVISFTTEKLFQ